MVQSAGSEGGVIVTGGEGHGLQQPSLPRTDPHPARGRRPSFMRRYLKDKGRGFDDDFDGWAAL